jgi:hypothetical protein
LVERVHEPRAWDTVPPRRTVKAVYADAGEAVKALPAPFRRLRPRSPEGRDAAVAADGSLC